MAIFFRLAVGLVELGALIWVFTTLADLKRGQAKILRDLSALTGSQHG